MSAGISFHVVNSEKHKRVSNAWWQICEDEGRYFVRVNVSRNGEGREPDELTWQEVRQVFGFSLVVVRGKASLRCSGRVVKVEK